MPTMTRASTVVWDQSAAPIAAKKECTASSTEHTSRATTPTRCGTTAATKNGCDKRLASPAAGMTGSALDTFANLELACDAMFDREPEWYSDEEEHMGDEQDCFEEEELEGVTSTRNLQLTTTGFMSIADMSSTNSSVFTDVLSSDGCASVYGDFASRIFQTSPPQAPVKRERDPSPILGGMAKTAQHMQTVAVGLPIAAMQAIDVDIPCGAPLSLDSEQFQTAIPITTTQIFGTRGKAAKKQKDAQGSGDNSDTQSCASTSSAASTCTNASFATTISGGSCYGFVPFYTPALSFQAPMMWRCRECNIMHPSDYQCCGKCTKQREEVEDTGAANKQAQQQQAALAAAIGWYSNPLSNPLSQAYSPQSLYPQHPFTPAFNGGGLRQPAPVGGGLRQPAPVATRGCATGRPSHSPNTSRRGENVKDNPQMQKTARDGQKHWHDKVQQMRAHHEEAQTSLVRAEFSVQRYFCNARNLKCQKESLLIFLQIATQKQIITPLNFVHPADDTSGFLGWTGFRILPGCGDKFRAGIEGLFPEIPKLNTLYHLFRRAGLVPEDWRRAWDGEVPFTWNPNRVS